VIKFQVASQAEAKALTESKTFQSKMKEQVVKLAGKGDTKNVELKFAITRRLTDEHRLMINVTLRRLTDERRLTKKISMTYTISKLSQTDANAATAAVTGKDVADIKSAIESSAKAAGVNVTVSGVEKATASVADTKAVSAAVAASLALVVMMLVSAVSTVR